jgi:cell wall-associated NlpC family hydrolase
MSTRSAARQLDEEQPVPPLQLLSRLEPGADGDGALLRTGPGLSLRAGLIALLGAAAIAAAVFLIMHRAHQASPRARAGLSTRERQQLRARLGLAGVRAAVNPVLNGATALGGQTLASSVATPAPHELSSSDLTTLAEGASLYQPPPYLVDAYRSVGARFHIPWRVIASVEYIEGGYVNAIAGTTAKAEQTVAAQVASAGRDVVDARVLAQATSAAAQPSASLISDAARLAADGAADSPAGGVATYLRDVPATPQAVMTLAQSIEPAATPTSSPTAKVTAMLNEAHLLNGLPYIWGGGHTNPAWVVGSGYDCSGFVSEVLHAAGYLTSPDTTQTLPGSAGIASGPGKLVTIYDRTIAKLRVWVKRRKMVSVRKIVNPTAAGVHVVRGRHGNSLTPIKLPKWVGEWTTIKLHKLVRSLDTTNNDEHVIIDIAGQWWESGGSTADGGAAMVHQIESPSAAYLRSFNQILHPAGL